MTRQNLINRRQALDLTQREVAELVGIKRSSYTAIELGLRNPSLETAQLICDVLKMPFFDAFPIKKKENKEN